MLSARSKPGGFFARTKVKKKVLKPGQFVDSHVVAGAKKMYMIILYIYISYMCIHVYI